MAYRADIEIAVKGAQELKRLQDRIQNVSTTVDNFNSKIEEIGGGYIVRNINNLTSLLGQAAAEFNKVALGTADATAAARTYIAANDQLNAGLAERVALLKSVNEQARQAKLTEANTRSGGPRIVETPNAYAGQIGPGPASPVALRSNLGNRVENALKAQNQALLDASTNLRIKQSWNKFFRDAATLGADLQVNAAAQRLNIKTSWTKFFRDAAAPTVSAPVKGGGGIGKGIGGAVSNAAIGGAFPLLFGQSGSAAAGGAIGGALGSAIPGIGGFGGSLIGTILGEKLGQGNKIKELAADIGLSAEQTKVLATAFKQAGADFDKFQESVSRIQGLSLSIEDQGRAIQLTSSLTESYGGKIDKVTNAFTAALQAGKVTQATLNQLTSQGIPIQQALADKYGISRDELLKYAKDGKISVQDLIDTLVDVGNKGQESATKQVDAFNDAYAQIEPLVQRLQTLFEGLFKFISDRLSSTLTEVLNTVSNIITGIETLANFIGPKFESLATTVSNALSKIQIPPWLASFIRQGVTNFAFLGLPGGAGLGALNQIGKDVNRNSGLSGRYIPGSQQVPIKDKLQTLRAPSQAAPGGGGGSNKAANDAKRLAEQTKKQLDDAFKLNELASARLEIQVSLAGEESLEAKFNKVALERRIKFLDLQKEAKSQKERELLLSAQLSTILADNNQYEKDKQKLFAQQTAELYTQIGLSDVLGKKFQGSLAGGFMGKSGTGTFRTDLNLMPGLTGGKLGEEFANIEQQLKDLLDPANQVITAANAIGTAFGESFKGLISGTLTAREALAGFFESIASSFADMAAQILAEYLKLQIIGVISKFFPSFGGIGAPNYSGAFGGSGGLGSSQFVAGNSFGGFLASGGPAMAGTPYIVGEKGPELFMPGRSGTVIPNNALGGSTNVVVNVDAKGSNVEGNDQNAKQLGLVISAAVQAELVKQKRPGGLLTR